MPVLKSQVRSLRSKLHYLKKKELALSVLAYDIEKMIDVCKLFSKIIYENEIEAFGKK